MRHAARARTDAWHPQVNGVVRSLEQIGAAAARWASMSVFVIARERSAPLPCPTYPEIRLALAVAGRGSSG